MSDRFRAHSTELNNAPILPLELSSVRWRKDAGIEYREYDGEHFKLGLTLPMIEMVLMEMLPWSSYKRDEGRFLDTEGNCWNNFGDKNGYDLGEVVRDFLRTNGVKNLSIAEVLWSEGKAGAGEATVFFSHIQQLPVQTALQTLREASVVYQEEMGMNPFFFVDYFCIRQATKGDFDLDTVRQAIHDTPRLLVELDDTKDDIGNLMPTYFRRSFCVFEVFAAVEGGTNDQKVLVSGPAVSDPETTPWLSAKVNAHGYNIVNSSDGECRWPVEKEKINAFIESSVGYKELDKVVGKAVADGCVYGLQVAAKKDVSQINIAAQVGVQAADLTDEQLQRFCDQHQSPELVHVVDLQQCKQITKVDSLCRFSELRQLEIAGCDNVTTESLVELFSTCAGLESEKFPFYLGRLARYDDLINYYTRNLEDARTSANRNLIDEIIAINALAETHGLLGNHQKQLEHSKQAHQLVQEHQEAGNNAVEDQIVQMRTLTIIYNNFGAAYNKLGEHTEALVWFEKMLEIIQRNEGLNEVEVHSCGQAIDPVPVLESVARAIRRVDRAIRRVDRVHQKGCENWAEDWQSSHRGSCVHQHG
jgi:tetratricopeptide (TPR) repeat protein